MTDNNQFITITGAREHNLKGVSVKIPKGKLVVFSGVSGSGKSSLAMDTLYAEGQRRYVESLSSYARQFLGMMKRPEVDAITGLSPAIAIDQHGLSHNPRSTVGTVTEIYDYLRVLFARLGLPHCPKCGRTIERSTSTSITGQIWQEIKDQTTKTGRGRFFILAPLVRDKKGEFDSLFKNLIKKGFDQIRIDGQLKRLDDDFALIKTNRHTIEVVIDKLSLNLKDLKKEFDQEFQKRLQDDVEIALETSNGLVILTAILDKGLDFPLKPQQQQDSLFSKNFACPVCNISLPEIEPRMFSFNSPQGACEECDGIGVKLKIDANKVSPYRASMLEAQYYRTSSDAIRQEIEKLMVRESCLACNGRRLNKQALSITINNSSIADISALPLNKLLEWSNALNQKLTTSEKEIAEPLLKEVNSRLQFLLAVGVDYLSLDRTASTLSVGEAQRIRLSSQIGTGLTGVLYILDEPTVGLHQKDTQKLIKTLTALRDLGNTVVVVEHDEEVIRSADWLIEFGPLAGKKGGQIIATGTPDQVIKNPDSLLGKYLSGKKQVSAGFKEYAADKKKLSISGCQHHNLKNIKVDFPLNTLTCITGISGSGKSSLINDTLYPALKQHLDQYFKDIAGSFSRLNGAEEIRNVLMVDQSPVGRTSRSNPATYIGVFTDIRDLMTETREAKLKGFSQSFFSFNVDGGRCEACKGQGQQKIEMQFLPDVWVKCEECDGNRFKQEVLEVEFKEKNIAQILDLTVLEALEFFAGFPKIIKKLTVLKEIGLDYLSLGQPSPTLSGGESQRLKIARELVKANNGQTVYLLDEPTTGLHFADIEKLLSSLRKLIDKGSSVFVIEHNLDVIKNADWLIDLGPEGGEKGGQVVAVGTVKQVANNKNSATGSFLKKYLK